MARVLDALTEPSFERTPDGRLVFYAWFGRGYEISERIHRTLGRETRWMAGMVLLGYPLAALLSVGPLGVYPVTAFVVLTALLGNLRIAWLIRGCPRAAERRSAREGRARAAAALSHRAIWGITLAFLAVATVSLGIAVVEEQPVLVVLAALYLGLATWIGGGLFRLKRRSGERDR